MVDPHAIVNFNDFFRARFQPSLPYGTHVAINSNIGHEELKHNAGLI